MRESIRADVCVVGAGSGGLSVAYVTSRLGLNTVLIEGHKMGGDCLNYGCVPSKALLAAAHAAERHRRSHVFGVNGSEPEIDFAKVHDHVHDVIAGIAPHDSVKRYEGLGARVILARARFTGPDRVEAGEYEIRARRFVIATGSQPAAPPIPGLADVPYLTNETVFDLTTLPAHLIVLGGGPIGAELAQAHRRLGARVTMLVRSKMLGRDDPELAEVVKDQLCAEGIDVNEGAAVTGVESHPKGIAVGVNSAAGHRQVVGSHLLVAAGRAPNVTDMGLETAGVEFGKTGVVVDQRLRTANRHVYAVGDVAGHLQFTHAAAYHAGIFIRNALFRMPAKVDYQALPWVTYTDPELAHVGLTEAEARGQDSSVRVVRWPFAENDRARAERETAGFVKVVASRKGRVLGASMVGANAGDLIQPWVLAINRKIPIRAMADVIAPYPTLGEVNKRAAGSFFTDSLFSDHTRGLVRFLFRLG